MRQDLPDLAALEVADEVPREQVPVGGHLRLEVLRAVLAHQGDTRLCQDRQVVEPDFRPVRAHVEPLQAGAIQSEVDGPRRLRRTAASARSAAASTARRLAFDFQVLARRCHAHRVQAGLHGDAHLIRIGLRRFTVGLNTDEPNLEDVLGIEREVIPHRKPTG